MTKEMYIHWLKNMIQGCIDMQGLEREKAIYQHCLKKARKLGQELPMHTVVSSTIITNRKNKIDNKKIDNLLDNK